MLFLAVTLIACSRTPEPPHGHPNKSAGHGAAAATPISEDQALTLLVAQLKAHKVADIECLQFFDESDDPPDTKAVQWQFAAHENHPEKCGGDPNTSPVRDRYKVDS